ncbi:MAG: diacylglycerol kinase family protein, partial [Sphingobacteriales bacterium]
GYALTGLRTLIKTEHNILVHTVATVIVIALGWWRGLSTVKWCIILGVIALVWICEAFNTALERLCDMITREQHPVIKQVKDVSSGAVLIAAILAVIVGILVFFS